jgi:hypothetical protein
MKIVIGAAPEAWVRALEEALGPSVADVHRYEQGKPLPTDEELLLIYTGPCYALEAAIEAKHEIESVIDGWTREAKDFLDFFRRNRGKVKIVNGPAILKHPKEFGEFCTGQFGISVPLDLLESAEAPRAKRPTAGVIAAQAAAASVELTDLTGELEASSIPLGQEPPRYTPEWRKACEEIHHLVEKKQEVKEKLEEKAAHLEEIKPECEKQTERIKELEEENELLLLQLHQVQEELESYYLEAKELREQRGGASSTDMDELLSYAVMLEHQYSKLLKSRTWKLMAPVREATRLIKSMLRGRRVPRNRLPKRPKVLADEPVGGRYGKRTRV